MRVDERVTGQVGCRGLVAMHNGHVQENRIVDLYLGVSDWQSIGCW